MNQNLSVNKKYVAIICYAIGPIMFGVLPVLVNAFNARLGFSVEESGFIASADLAGLFVGQILTAIFIRKLSARKVALIGALLFSGGNFLTPLTDTFTSLVTIRFLSEIGGGIFIALCMTFLSRTENPDRYIGFSVSLQLMLTIGLLLTAPLMLDLLDISGFFIVLAFLSCLTFLAVIYPLDIDFTIGMNKSISDKKLTSTDKNALVGIASILIYWVGIGALWSFIEVIGSEKGLSSIDISNGLAFSQLAGFAGAMFTAWLSNRIGRLFPTLIALACQAVAVAMLGFEMDFMLFLFSLSLFSFTWNVVLIFQLAIVADFDQKGIFTSIGTASQALGVAIGPAIVALTMTDVVLMPVIILMIVSVILCALISIYIRVKANISVKINEVSKDNIRNVF